MNPLSPVLEIALLPALTAALDLGLGDLGALSLAAVPDALVVVLAALGLDLLFGGPRGLRTVTPGPRQIFQGWAAGLERRLNRSKRSARDRQVRGFLAVVSLALAGAAIGSLLHLLALSLPPELPFGFVIELLAVTAMLSPRYALGHLRKIARALRWGGLNAGAAALREFLGPDDDTLDEHLISRRAIEAAARASLSRLAGPVFWYVLLGLPGLFAYVAICESTHTMASYQHRHLAFGSLVRGLDDAVNYLPAWLAAGLFALATLIAPTTRPGEVFRVILRDARRHPSLSLGPVIAALAGALGLTLAGPQRVDGHQRGGEWIGEGRAMATVADITRAAYLYAVANLFLAAGLALALLFTGS